MSKSLSAFCSTSLQHLSACGGRHSLTETVYFALLSFLGLIRSFHNLSPDFGFLSFWSYTAFFPTITLIIISQTTEVRQAILMRFLIFVRGEAAFLRQFVFFDSDVVCKDVVCKITARRVYVVFILEVDWCARATPDIGTACPIRFPA